MFELEVFIENLSENQAAIEKFYDMPEINNFIDNSNNFNIEKKINYDDNQNELNKKDNDYINQQEKSYDYQLEGKVKLYKKNYENISLTNPQQNFRYLPINRKNLVRFNLKCLLLFNNI